MVTKEEAKASQAQAAAKEAAAQKAGTIGSIGAGIPSGPPSGAGEAKRQAEIHGITKGGQFTRELSQREFSQLSSELQAEYNRQAMESQRQAQQAKQKEEQATIETKRKEEVKEERKTIGVRKIGGAYVPESLLSEDVRQREEARSMLGELRTYEVKAADTTTLEADIKRYEGLVEQFERGGSADEKLYEQLQGLYTTVSAGIKAENIARQEKYESDIASLAGGIVKEGKGRGAAKVQIYTPKGEPIGALGIEGAEEPLKYLLRTGEFQIGYTIPRTSEEKKAQAEQKQFWESIKSEQRLGASGFEVYSKEGKLVGVASAKHPRFDILKLQKEYDEVSVKTKFTPGLTEPVLKGYAKAPLGEPVEFTRGLADTLQALGVELGTGGSGTTEPPKEIKEIKEKYIPPTAIDPILSGRPTEKSLLYNIGSTIGLVGTLGLGVVGVGGRAKAVPQWTGIDIAKKPVRVIKPSTLTFRPTNIFREPLPKDIFRFDVAETPKISATPPRPLKPFFESGQEAIAKAKKSSEILLEPIPPSITKPPKVLGPKFTDIFETKGRPPIKREPTFEVFGEKAPIEEPLPRAEMVELTKIKLEHEVFSARGKLLGIVGETGPPQGALAKIRATKPPEQLPPEIANPLGRRGRPPIERVTIEKLPPSRAERVGLEGRLYPTKGIGALAKGKKKPLEVQEVKGYKPDISEFFIRPRKIDTERLLDIERPEIGTPKDFLEALNVAKKQPTKPKPPQTQIRFEPRRFIEPEAPRRSTRPITILIAKQETKLATKPITKKKTKQELRYAITGSYQEEEQAYQTKYRPRVAARTILITPAKIETRQGLDLRQMLGIRPTTKTGPRQILAPSFLPIQTPREKQRPKLTPRFAIIEVPSGRGIPRTKQPVALAPKQKTPQLTREVLRPPLKPPRFVFAWPPPPTSGRRTKEPKEREPGLRADFLGNVRVSNIEGIYSRSEVTYGQKRINKLLREDRPRGTKFVRGSAKSFLKKTRQNLLSRPKKTRAFRL